MVRPSISSEGNPRMATITTLDGSIIAASITGITPHDWTANASGLFLTGTDLATEWKANYATMLAGRGDTLTAVQRMEGNAEAVIENTRASRLSTASQATLRQDLQREYDVIGAAMRIDQTQYGIDPAAPLNSYGYLKLSETIRGNEQLTELADQGHGLNSPPAPRYSGYTTDYQNKTDGSTFFVGGGLDTGENAIAAFLDDVALTHVVFATVLHNGVLTQLNQNGNFEQALTVAVGAFDEAAYTRVFTASDFSTSKTAVGSVQLIPNVTATPPVPTATNPPGALPTTVIGYDGTILPAHLTGLTAHEWQADQTGLYLTYTDLATEWHNDDAIMLAGGGASLTALQRMEGNAEAVIQNTRGKTLTFTAQTALRQDLQREFDAIDAAMRINQTKYGTDPTVAFTALTYQQMEHTLQGNGVLQELGIQGHGINNPTVTKYDGFTTDFQNRIDGSTLYVGGGPGTGELAIANFLDDDVLTHAPFAIVEHNGVATQLNQNGNLEDTLTDVLTAANNTAFNRVLVAGDFSTDKTVTGPVVFVPGTGSGAAAAVAAPAVADVTFDPAYYAANNPDLAATGVDLGVQYASQGWKVGANPNALFDTQYYLLHNPDVAAAGLDPLWHYENWGWHEGRDPSLLFSTSQYLAQNPDVAAAGLDPLQHYLQWGVHEGRPIYLAGGTAPEDLLVQASYYDPQLGATFIPTGDAAMQQAAADYNATGWQRGLNPDPLFDTTYYLAHNPDVAAAHINPLLHYEQYGWHEGRDPSAAFSTSKYEAAYADVKAAGVDPLLHYVQWGQAEGRTAFAV